MRGDPAITTHPTTTPARFTKRTTAQMSKMQMTEAGRVYRSARPAALALLATTALCVTSPANAALLGLLKKHPDATATPGAAAPPSPPPAPSAAPTVAATAAAPSTPLPMPSVAPTVAPPAVSVPQPFGAPGHPASNPANPQAGPAPAPSPSGAGLEWNPNGIGANANDIAPPGAPGPASQPAPTAAAPVRHPEAHSSAASHEGDGSTSLIAPPLDGAPTGAPSGMSAGDANANAPDSGSKIPDISWWWLLAPFGLAGIGTVLWSRHHPDAPDAAQAVLTREPVPPAPPLPAERLPEAPARPPLAAPAAPSPVALEAPVSPAPATSEPPQPVISAPPPISASDVTPAPPPPAPAMPTPAFSAAPVMPAALSTLDEATTPPPPAHSAAPLADMPDPLDIAFEPLGLRLSLVYATLRYRLVLTALHDMPTGHVLGDMISAHGSLSPAEQLAPPPEMLTPLAPLPPMRAGERRERTGEMALPLSAIRAVRRGDASFLVPLVRLCLLREGAPPMRRVFTLGLPGEGPGLAPLPLGAPRNFEPLAAREVEQARTLATAPPGQAVG